MPRPPFNPADRRSKSEIDAEYNTSLFRRRRAIMDTVEAIFAELQHFCACCWAKAGAKNPKDHTFFSGCKKYLGTGFMDGVGWRECKKQVLLSNGHCFYCSLPSWKWNLSHHTEKRGKGTGCPYEDYVCLVWWHVYHDRELWQACQRHYQLSSLSEDEWFQWLTSDDGTLFYHGLEVFLWYCKGRGLWFGLE